jgi:hypothetical protein
MTDISAVLSWKHPTVEWTVSDNVVVEFEGGVPSAETLATWSGEYEAAKPWEDLREERNRRLAETDWWASSDLTMTDEQKLYRAQLRDLPATTKDPANPTWPTKP